MAFHPVQPPKDASTDASGRESVSRIVEMLLALSSDGGGWWIASARSYRFRLPVTSPRMDEGALETIRPRAAGWRRDRMPALPDADVIDKVPDWVCEIEDSRGAYASLLKAHEQAGVIHAWMLDPVALTLAVYTRRRAAWSESQVYRATGRVRIPPFEAIELDVSTFWGPL